MSAPNRDRPKYGIDSIKEYCYCPLYYRFKNESSMAAETTGAALHRECIRRVAYYILYASQGDRFPTRAGVKGAYGRLLKAVFGSSQARNLSASMLASGLEQCLGVHDFLKRYGGRPVLINKKYTLDLGEAVVEGTMDAVLETRDTLNYGNEGRINGQRRPLLELVILAESKTGTDRVAVTCDLAVIAAALACRQLLARPLDNVLVYYFRSGTFERIKLNARDVHCMEKIISSVIKAIESGIYYPSAGRDCRSCQYSAFCSKGSWLL